MLGLVAPATIGPPLFLIVGIPVVVLTPPLGALVHGVRSDGPLARTYLVAGSVCLGFVVVWVYAGILVTGVASQLVFLGTAAAVVGSAIMHVSRALDAGLQSAFWLTVVYSPTALLLGWGMLWT